MDQMFKIEQRNHSFIQQMPRAILGTAVKSGCPLRSPRSGGEQGSKVTALGRPPLDRVIPAFSPHSYIMHLGETCRGW